MEQSPIFCHFNGNIDGESIVTVQWKLFRKSESPQGTDFMFLEIDGINIPVEYTQYITFFSPGNAREASGYVGNSWRACFGCRDISFGVDEYMRAQEGIDVIGLEKSGEKTTFEISWKYEFLDQPRTSWPNAAGEYRYNIVLEAGKGSWSGMDKKGDFKVYTNDEIEKMQGIWPLGD